MKTATTVRDGGWRQVPASVWVLGFVSLLMDVSSEMVHCLLPMFMVGTLGASVSAVGAIEGFAEATALIVKVFSGTLSDRLGRRKALAVFGYTLGAATKPLFALAGSVGTVLAARVVDRGGKGIRGAPRDALVADSTPPHLRGAAFGLRQSLDSVGAVAGPLAATGLMIWWAGDYRAVFWFAVLPAFMSVALLAIGAVFTLARFSEAFLVLRALQLGVPPALVPLVMVVMSAVYALSAYPFGALSDRVSHRQLLAWGMGVLIAADAVLALAGGWPALLAGVALWGMHMGMTQGLLAAMVADTAPADLRGTAFGFFNLASGVAMFVASALAGLVWDAFGAAATFWSGAGLAILTLLGLALRPDAGAVRDAG